MVKIFLIVTLILGVLIGLVFLPRDFNSKEEVIFRIERGQGSKEIARNLQEEGLVWWGSLFRVYVFVSGKSGNLQAGSYSLSPSMNIPDIAKKLASGDIAKEKITIPEGFTSLQIYERLARTVLANNVSRTVLETFGKHEGYLFPDTYEISYGTPVENIIQAMRDNFDKKTAGLGIRPGVVTMASLLEKEVKTKEEKELAAGVLWKRLRAGVPLQVDAAPETYEKLGLPEKPICNPGLESILAALYPKSSNFWYYLSKPDGETIFQKTLDEHNIAKAKYLR